MPIDIPPRSTPEIRAPLPDQQRSARPEATQTAAVQPPLHQASFQATSSKATPSQKTAPQMTAAHGAAPSDKQAVNVKAVEASGDRHAKVDSAPVQVEVNASDMKTLRLKAGVVYEVKVAEPAKRDATAATSNRPGSAKGHSATVVIRGRDVVVKSEIKLPTGEMLKIEIIGKPRGSDSSEYSSSLTRSIQNVHQPIGRVLHAIMQDDAIPNSTKAAIAESLGIIVRKSLESNTKLNRDFNGKVNQASHIDPKKALSTTVEADLLGKVKIAIDESKVLQDRDAGKPLQPGQWQALEKTLKNLVRKITDEVYNKKELSGQKVDNQSTQEKQDKAQKQLTDLSARLNVDLAIPKHIKIDIQQNLRRLNSAQQENIAFNKDTTHIKSKDADHLRIDVASLIERSALLSTKGSQHPIHKNAEVEREAWGKLAQDINTILAKTKISTSQGIFSDSVEKLKGAAQNAPRIPDNIKQSIDKSLALIQAQPTYESKIQAQAQVFIEQSHILAGVNSLAAPTAQENLEMRPENSANISTGKPSTENKVVQWERLSLQMESLTKELRRTNARPQIDLVKIRQTLEAITVAVQKDLNLPQELTQNIQNSVALFKTAIDTNVDGTALVPQTKKDQESSLKVEATLKNAQTIISRSGIEFKFQPQPQQWQQLAKPLEMISKQLPSTTKTTTTNSTNESPPKNTVLSISLDTLNAKLQQEIRLPQSLKESLQLSINTLKIANQGISKNPVKLENQTRSAQKVLEQVNTTIKDSGLLSTSNDQVRPGKTTHIQAWVQLSQQLQALSREIVQLPTFLPERKGGLPDGISQKLEILKSLFKENEFRYNALHDIKKIGVFRRDAFAEGSVANKVLKSLLTKDNVEHLTKDKVEHRAAQSIGSTSVKAAQGAPTMERTKQGFSIASAALIKNITSEVKVDLATKEKIQQSLTLLNVAAESTGAARKNFPQGQASTEQNIKLLAKAEQLMVASKSATALPNQITSPYPHNLKVLAEQLFKLSTQVALPSASITSSAGTAGVMQSSAELGPHLHTRIASKLSTNMAANISTKGSDPSQKPMETIPANSSMGLITQKNIVQLGLTSGTVYQAEVLLINKETNGAAPGATQTLPPRAQAVLKLTGQAVIVELAPALALKTGQLVSVKIDKNHQLVIPDLNVSPQKTLLTSLQNLHALQQNLSTALGALNTLDLRKLASPVQAMANQLMNSLQKSEDFLGASGLNKPVSNEQNQGVQGQAVKQAIQQSGLFSENRQIRLIRLQQDAVVKNVLSPTSDNSLIAKESTSISTAGMPNGNTLAKPAGLRTPSQAPTTENSINATTGKKFYTNTTYTRSPLAPPTTTEIKTPEEEALLKSDLKVQLSKLLAGLKSPEQKTGTDGLLTSGISPTANPELLLNTLSLSSLSQSLAAKGEAAYDEKNIGLLLRLLAGALNRIQYHQLTSVKRTLSDANELSGVKSFQLELPFWSPRQQIDSCLLRFDESPDEGGKEKLDQEKQRQWSISLAFDLEDLGPMFVKVRLVQQGVSATIWAENSATFNLIQQQVEGFRERLQQQGLEVRDLQIQRCAPSDIRTKIEQHFVDITA